MSEYVPDTPYVGRLVCPVCEEVDPLTEITETRWCEAHRPDADGDCDALVGVSTYLAGGAEAEGETCRAWAAWLEHR